MARRRLISRTTFSFLAVLLVAFLSPIKTASAEAVSSDSFVPGQVLVRVQENLSPAQVQKLAESVQADVERKIAPWGLYLLRFDPEIPVEQVLQKLKALPAVQYAEPDIQYQVNSIGDSFSQAGSSFSTTTATSSSSIVVAVIDTGIDLSHPTFAGKLVPGYDFYDHDADPSGSKWDAHGTQTAGRVLQGAGDAPVAILPLRAGTSSGLSMSAVIEAITYATNQGARIISMSFGATAPWQALEDALQYASDHGVLLIASAGNSGNDKPMYPAAYDKLVVSVAASNASGAKASWSSYGPSVDFTAPGDKVVTTTWGGGTATVSGTSFSAPFVAGVAAQILAANPGLTPAQVLDRLALFAKDVDALNPSYKGLLGRGLVDELVAFQVTLQLGDPKAAQQQVDRLQAALGLAEKDLAAAQGELSAVSKDLIRAGQDLGQSWVRFIQASRFLDSYRRSRSGSAREINSLLKEYADALDQYWKAIQKYLETYQRYAVAAAQAKKVQDRRDTLAQQLAAARQYVADLNRMQPQHPADAVSSPAGYQQSILQQLQRQQAVQQLLQSQLAVDGIDLQESDPIIAPPDSLRNTK